MAFSWKGGFLMEKKCIVMDHGPKLAKLQSIEQVSLSTHHHSTIQAHLATPANISGWSYFQFISELQKCSQALKFVNFGSKAYSPLS